jgi:diguanylate cyclase (GGDEF)-like protein
LPSIRKQGDAAMKSLSFLEKQNKLLLIVLGFALIAAIGWIDFLTGYEFSISVFYVIPISLITWTKGRRLGFVASLASALVWLDGDLASGHPYTNPYYPYWNSFIQFSFFIIIAWLLSTLKEALNKENELAKLDYLTGAKNARYFYELAQVEIDRFQRYKHPFTLAYLDLDNFKAINDQLGHMAGDQVLRAVVTCMRQNTRATDTIARVGGDEFTLLLPETNQASARVALANIHANLVQEMHAGGWPVTFSIGVLSCHTEAPTTTDELIKTVDKLMYLVKNDSKNGLLYSIYAAKPVQQM